MTIMRIFGVCAVLSLATAGVIEPGYRAPGSSDRSAGYSHGNGYPHGGSYGERQSNSGKGQDIQKESKYYYGGQYKENCLGDGLYYKNDNMFVICSNGYPHEQPCPPGTKTAGYPSYKAGYYYGYTDLCSVNLVDYGLGPEHYAPTGFVEKESSYGSKEVVATYDKKTQYTPPKDTAAYGYNKDKDYARGGSNYAGQRDSYGSAGNAYNRSPEDGYSGHAAGSYAGSHSLHGSYPQLGGSAYGSNADYSSQHRAYPSSSNEHLPKNRY